MTHDEIRELFSAYHDRELSQERHDAVRDALAADEELANEYKSFCAVIDGLTGLGAAPPGVEEAPPELLRGVQRKLHTRSGGRFYADRWSRAAGIFPLEFLAALVLIALVIAYFAMTSISVAPVSPPR